MPIHRPAPYIERSVDRLNGKTITRHMMPDRAWSVNSEFQRLSDPMALTHRHLFEKVPDLRQKSKKPLDEISELWYIMAWR
jgi:hypothetical protein